MDGPGLPPPQRPGVVSPVCAMDARIIPPRRRTLMDWLTGAPWAGQGPAMSGQPSPVVSVGSVRFGNRLPLTLIAGPCALESRAHALEMASALKEIAARAGIGLVYKTSFDKANRTSAASARGLGLDQSLGIFAELREKLQVPVLTDVHEAEQCER